MKQKTITAAKHHVIKNLCKELLYFHCHCFKHVCAGFVH